MQCIPLLFHERNSQLILEKKLNFFLFFAKLCSLRNSDSPLPSEAIQKMDNSLYSVRFSVDDKSELTNNLDSNKGRG